MRYDRQIALPEIGERGQLLLAEARVLIVGVGGLGSPIALYLAAAGVGHIGLLDDDVVSMSNLQRQVLYNETQLNLPKTLCAQQNLKSLNSSIELMTHNCRLNVDNALQIIADYDYVIDGSDNFATRYAIDDACKKLNTPYIYGAISEFAGQVAVFDYLSEVSYRMLYPDEEFFCSLNSNALPVLGTTPAVVGSIMAHQLLQLVCGFGSPLRNELFVIDLLSMSTQRIKL